MSFPSQPLSLRIKSPKRPREELTSSPPAEKPWTYDNCYSSHCDNQDSAAHLQPYPSSLEQGDAVKNAMASVSVASTESPGSGDEVAPLHKRVRRSSPVHVIKDSNESAWDRGSTKSLNEADVESSGDDAASKASEKLEISSPTDGDGNPFSLFACPFFRHNPLMHMSCLTHSFGSLRELGDHLETLHDTIICTCAYCLDPFLSERKRRCHCQAQSCGFESKGPRPSGQWAEIWKLYFPDAETTANPYMRSLVQETLGVLDVLCEMEEGVRIKHPVLGWRGITLDDGQHEGDEALRADCFATLEETKMHLRQLGKVACLACSTKWMLPAHRTALPPDSSLFYDGPASAEDMRSVKDAETAVVQSALSDANISTSSPSPSPLGVDANGAQENCRSPNSSSSDSSSDEDSDAFCDDFWGGC